MKIRKKKDMEQNEEKEKEKLIPVLEFPQNHWIMVSGDKSLSREINLR